MVSGQLPPRKIATRLGLGFRLGLLGVIFLGGNCPRTVLDIYETKLIEHNKNFEPNLQSFSLLNHQLQAVAISADFIKWNSFVLIFSRKSFNMKIQ